MIARRIHGNSIWLYLQLWLLEQKGYQKKNQQREKVHVVKSGGNQVQTSKSCLLVDPQDTLNSLCVDRESTCERCLSESSAERQCPRFLLEAAHGGPQLGTCKDPRLS